MLLLGLIILSSFLQVKVLSTQLRKISAVFLLQNFLYPLVFELYLVMTALCVDSLISFFEVKLNNFPPLVGF